MPDQLERAAGFGATPAPAPMRIVPVDPSGVDPNALLASAAPVDDQGNIGVRPGGPSPTGTVAEGEAGATPSPDILAQMEAKFAEREKNLVKGWNRSMQELADQRKTLEQELAYVRGLRDAGVQGQTAQERKTAFDRLPPEAKARFANPEGQEAINTIGLVLETLLGEKESQWEQKYAPREAVAIAQNAQASIRAQQLAQEVQQLQPTFGPVFEEHGNRILDVLKANPQMNVMAATLAVAPQQAHAAIEANVRQKLVEEMTLKQQAALLEGQGRPSVTASEWSSDPAKESMEDMARRFGLM